MMKLLQIIRTLEADQAAEITVFQKEIIHHLQELLVMLTTGL